MPKHVTISIKPDQRLSRYGVWCFQEYNAPQVSHDMLQSSPPSTKHQTMFDKAQALVHALPCLDSANHPLSLLLLFILLCVFVLLCLVSFFVLVTFPLEPPFRPSTMLPPQHKRWAATTTAAAASTPFSLAQHLTRKRQGPHQQPRPKGLFDARLLVGCERLFIFHNLPTNKAPLTTSQQPNHKPHPSPPLPFPSLAILYPLPPLLLVDVGQSIATLH